MNATLPAVRALVAEVFGLPADAVDPDAPLVALGGESLALLALTRRLHDRFGVRLPVRTLFEDELSVRAVTARLAPEPDPGPPDGAGRMPGAAVDFSLYFFGDYPHGDGPARYEALLSAAEFADTHGFHALWVPERHFHSFGGLFPNPAVLAAALAARTRSVRLHAGSVVLPLHHPVRVAEEWSMVDNLSGGRAGLCVASGWHSGDFVLAPGTYDDRREVMYERLATVRRLWAGAPHTAVGGDGERVDVTLHPAPVQARPPLAVAVLSAPGSWERAAREDVGVVTNLMQQDVDDLARNIALYRRTRAACGLDPRAGRVTVLVHTYLRGDSARARREAYAPFTAYLRSSLSLFDTAVRSLGVEVDLAHTPPDDVAFLLGRAYERYCATRALIGTPAEVRPVLDSLVAAGADEIGAFVDFGLPAADMLAGLPHLAALKDATPARPGLLNAGSVETECAGPDFADGDQAGRLAAGTAVAEAAPAVTTPVMATPDITASTVAAPLVTAPASPQQRRMWLMDRMDPGRSVHNEPKAVELTGPLDPDALAGALTQVVARHDALRTSFREEEGVLRQVIAPPFAPVFPVTDLTGRTPQEAVAVLHATHGTAPFDLAMGPLWRVALGVLGPEHHVLYLVAHHSVFDAGSTAVFLRDLATCLGGGAAALPPLPAPPAPDPRPEREAGLAFWTRLLRDAPVLRLPADRPRDATRPVRGATLAHEFDAALARRVRAFGRSVGATAFTTLLSAVASVLGRFGDTDDVVLGTAVSHRPPGTEDRIGMYVETLALRLDLSGDPSFAALVRRVRGAVMDALEHRDVPLDEVVDAVNPQRSPGANPLFDILVEYEEAPDGAADGAGPAARPLHVPRAQAPFALTLYFTGRRDGLGCTVEYDAGLFEAATLTRLLGHVEELLRRGLDDSAGPLSALAGPTAADEHFLALHDGSAAAIPPAPRDGATGAADAGAVPDVAEADLEPTTLHGLFERSARAEPDAVALSGAHGTTTYRALDAAANRLAHRLTGEGVTPGSTVAVLLPRGPGLVTALLAVLKCGAAYVPVDPALPAARRDALVRDSGAVLVLDDPHADPDLPAVPPGAAVEPDATAYLIFTSGTTGGARAVAVPHRGPVALLRWQARAHPPLRTLQWTSPSFDVSVQEIFGTLGSGAELVLLDEADRLDPAVVGEIVRRHEVERLCVPATPLAALVRGAGPMPSLREVFCAGEPLRTVPPIARFLAEQPHTRLFNQYGPTEASVIVTEHHVTPADDAAPPIGRPVTGVLLRVEDRRGRPVPPGVPGELLIGGAQVADGYRNDPELTARRFHDDGTRRWFRTGDLVRFRHDGALEHLGRLDDQVKIRGFRVEPGEAEAALNALPEVVEAAVLAEHEPQPRLVAHVVLRGELADWVSVLRAGLARTLPDHLVPAAWFAVDRLPVGANGKLDRAALRGSTGGGALPEGRPPATADEERVHRLWCLELGVESLPVDVSFFQVGGNSLHAVRMLERIRGETGERVPMADFLRAPTIHALARRRAGAR
ncbi:MULTISPECIES: MupA/Atu3671 family FMN-dependent luciferase-like monooxygenase [unclassified Streptomyces]|uniref:MupA/Atu3671 family FMN-dependent luciferase-like monooxygenase n=1 Tax=unclassified Streptomyces TaxID=2593676 RepID=UPI000DC57E3C|nr:MupA/Atu3671 family FMN-dependent luciferase-like monooxygenase [Streptomyces sp. PsTaAH-137]RAJ76870.1 amino acid adenylation domain-containing protein/natural product biosynthesis luciferase-like monooxygenase protein [Streptomyces sp. PsTaAH-137]